MVAFIFNPLSNSVVGVAGTSYSSPLALRTAVGTAVSTEHELSTIALKALMIHQAETLPRQKKTEVGWGRFKENPIHILECGPASATIIFNGLLPMMVVVTVGCILGFVWQILKMGIEKTTKKSSTDQRDLTSPNA